MIKNRYLRFILGASLGAFVPSSFAVSHSLTYDLSAADLVDLLVPASGGITVIGAPTLTGYSSLSDPAYVSGSFLVTGGGSGIPFSDGIILSTGDIHNSLGPNDNIGVSSVLDAPGSALLESVNGLSAGLTSDAVTLSFQFSSATPTFSFQYMFASEEYNELFSGDYNDAFAVVLDGPGVTQQNIAKVPLTSTDVSIASVNGSSNSDYYFDNNAGAFDIQYNGLVGSSGGLSIFATGNVLVGEVYTISIVLADVLDPSFDSALFLKGGSFVADGYVPPTEPVPEPATCLGAVALSALIARKLARPRRHC